VRDAFDSEHDAIELANRTRYGLAAYIWTTNLSGHRVADAIESECCGSIRTTW